MKLKMLFIYGKGDLIKEYIALEAVEDCDLQFYILADTSYTSENTVSTKLRHFYWFKHKLVKKGDRVILRTESGKDDTYTTKNAVRVHRIFWGLQNAAWSDVGNAAILFHIDLWTSMKN